MTDSLAFERPLRSLISVGDSGLVRGSLHLCGDSDERLAVVFIASVATATTDFADNRSFR